MKKFKILALLAVMAILWTIPAMAFAQEVPPAVVIGTASNNGVPVAAGTTITAHVSGSDVGSAKTSAGGKFQVTAKGVKGDTLTFTIGEATASESIKLADNGEVLRQDLSVGAGSSGADGSAGSKGATGATGAKGDSGAKGDTGAAGAAGAAGPSGAAGAAGPAGAAGANGADGTSGGGSMGIIALILAIVAIVVAGAGFFMRKQS
ncbi:MAG TPA: hypothetical protein DEZ08_04580 [Dehalococcoidia bacterium]|jgi:cobalamin biosynthesis Mg chelatase CobN|nr:hypothetical protein [Dehalococcoidia bacterium]|tara:strand:- start:80 stop:697 length:618 start_codon:yes stop_codon:yes gene_type:complete